MSTKRRKAPGSTGKGKFYHIEIRPKYEFDSFRVQDVGEKGGLERLAGKRPSGTWDTATWLVSKDKVEIKNGKLIINGEKDKAILKDIKGPIVHVKGDIFRAHPVHHKHRKTKPKTNSKKVTKKI